MKQEKMLFPIILSFLFFSFALIAHNTPCNARHIAQRLATGCGLKGLAQPIQSEFALKRSARILHAIDTQSPQRAIVVGASSGMGRELSKLLAANGYIVGMTARRMHLLEETQKTIPTQTYIAYMDASQPDKAVAVLSDLITEMGGMDLLVLAPTGYHECNFDSTDWHQSEPVLAVDIMGFFALARTGLTFFEQQGYGHLVGFSSIDGIRGIAGAPAYSAAKAFCSRYLQAEFNKYAQKNMPIFVTDICPGWINSDPSVDYSNMPHTYWVESLADATQEIFEAIQNKVEIAYITKRWSKVAELLSTMPNDLYNALSARPGGGF